MNRRTLLNIGLLLLVALLVGVVLYEPGLEQPVADSRLTSLQAAEIDQITIERPSGEPILLARGADGWRMTSPRTLPANELRVERILNIAQQVSHAHYTTAEAELEPLGLVPPRTILKLNTTTLQFGDSEPLNHRRYTRIGETIHLIDDLAYHHLTGNWPSFVSTKLLTGEPQLTRIALPELTLQLGDTGSWEVVGAESQPSTESITALIEAWSSGYALEVKRYQAVADAEPITVTVAGREEPIRFEITAHTPESILARPERDIQYHFSPRQIAILLKLATEPAANDQPTAH